MKLIKKTFVLAIVVFVVIPFTGVIFLPPHWGLPFLLLTMYILNPSFFIYIGMITGRNIKNVKIASFLPILALLIFLLSTYLIYGVVEPILIVINLVAFVVSILVTFFIKKEDKSS